MIVLELRRSAGVEFSPLKKRTITSGKVALRTMSILNNGNVELDQNDKNTKSHIFFKTTVYKNSEGLKCIDNVAYRDGFPIATRERIFVDKEKIIRTRHALRKQISKDPEQYIHLQLFEETEDGQHDPGLIVVSGKHFRELPIKNFNDDQVDIIATFLEI